MIPYFPAIRPPRFSLRGLRRAAPLGLAATLLLTSGCTVQANATGWISLGAESGAAAESTDDEASPPARLGVNAQVSATVQPGVAPSVQITFGPRCELPPVHRHVR